MNPTMTGTETTFLDRANIMVKRGIPVIPLRPQTKTAVKTGWQHLATTDINQIMKWDAENDQFNCAAVFQLKLGGFWALEIDGAKLIEQYKTETSKKLPETLMVRSRPGRGHLYFKHSPASIALGNIGQKEADGFSVRADDQYCVSPLSIHPDTLTPYEIVHDRPIIEAPDDFVAWLAAHKKVAAKELKAEGWLNQPIPQGRRDNTLVQMGGHYRRLGEDEETIFAILTQKNETLCSPPLPEEDIRRIAHSVARYKPGEATVTLGGKPQDGPEASRPEEPTSPAAVDVSKWRTHFRHVGELQKGEVIEYVKGFLPEGVTFIGALAGHGKTFISLSLARALVKGEPFVGQFPVKQKMNVLYLMAESGDRAFGGRAYKFGIPENDSFLCRTVTQGLMPLLSDPIILEAVRRMKPIVFIDTAIRFSSSTDENASTQNRQMYNDISALREAGAPAVVALHHSIKSAANEKPTLENTLRGSGDIGAAIDNCWSIRRDELLWDNERGPTELSVVNVKPRDFKPVKPFKLAASVRDSTGEIVSVIDRDGDFTFIEGGAFAKDLLKKFITLIEENSRVSRAAIAKSLGITEWGVRELAEKHGFKKDKGSQGHWHAPHQVTTSGEVPADNKPDDVGEEVEGEGEPTAHEKEMMARRQKKQVKG